ncbi:MAG: S1 RNA-binding domain-containing protein [Eubacteriales bacterium]|nr:S1 RNA-binding domain-containing protein [Eubacteriales bacterium]
MPLEVGNIVEGKVSGITKFGAFVKLPDGITGLVHISEVAEGYVKDVATYLQENQTVKVKVLSVEEGGKVSLSIKKALEKKVCAKREAGVSRPTSDWRSERQPETSFEDRLARFMKDSDEKLSDLKKSVDSKRGGRSYRRSSQ